MVGWKMQMWYVLSGDNDCTVDKDVKKQHSWSLKLTRFSIYFNFQKVYWSRDAPIQQLYVLPTLYLCVLYLSENKQRLVPLTA